MDTGQRQVAVVGESCDDSYAARFHAAIKACACDWNDPLLTPETFPEDVFGPSGEHDGLVLVQPPASPEVVVRGYWLDDEIDAWLASDEVAGMGFEAAYLRDLAEYGQRNPEAQRTKAILCWRLGGEKKDFIALLAKNNHQRAFHIFRLHEGDLIFCCWFLLRKVRKT